MSVTAQPLATVSPVRSRQLGPRLLVAALAVCLVAGAVALLVAWLSPAAPSTPVRAPFGLGAREAAPAATGLGATLLALQGTFYRSLQEAVSALKENGAALWSLLGIGFAYGVFHAAGPGHGKAVISAYLVANERALRKGFALSMAAALVQAAVAVGVVGIAAVILNVTAATMTSLSSGVELASFACVVLMGAAVTWRKAGALLGVAALARNPQAGAQMEGCDHAHLPPPEAMNRLTRWREMAGVVLAAGLRPCAGALVVLVFALSQGLFAAGIGSTVAMALGTALTTGLIASLAVFAKGLALRLAGGRGARGSLAVAAIELLAATFVLVLGTSLLFGLWTSSAGA